MRCWDDMHRISASLKDGTVTAVLLVALPRLGAARTVPAAPLDDTPLELIGIDRPFTAADLQMIDRAVGIGAESGST